MSAVPTAASCSLCMPSLRVTAIDPAFSGAMFATARNAPTCSKAYWITAPAASVAYPRPHADGSTIHPISTSSPCSSCFSPAMPMTARVARSSTHQPPKPCKTHDPACAARSLAAACLSSGSANMAHGFRAAVERLVRRQMRMMRWHKIESLSAQRGYGHLHCGFSSSQCAP